MVADLGSLNQRREPLFPRSHGVSEGLTLGVILCIGEEVGFFPRGTGQALSSQNFKFCVLLSSGQDSQGDNDLSISRGAPGY